MELIYCTKCKIIFNDSHKRCPRCGNKKLRQPFDNDAVFLVYINEQLKADMLMNMLKENDIPFIKHDKSGAAAFRAVFGANFLSIAYDIFVPYSAYKKATDLLVYFKTTKAIEIKFFIIFNYEFFKTI
ncbi:MAG: hypothetical protein FWE03_01865 [Firmicutes bacterium]|nr:hypothetical protein [Bacillota bacterium]